MPMYRPDRVEYTVTSGNIQIALEDGQMLPAYWAHPNIGHRFPGIVLIHDWWGVNNVVRHLAQLFAQSGHYVIVPDLFNGKIATTHSEALALVDELGNKGYRRIHSALSVLESHHRSNGSVAAVGVGMGGSLAFEAAIVRTDLEAAVAYAGFPQRYLGHFKRARTPILAFYGTEEKFIPREVIDKLRQELAVTPNKLPHEVYMLSGAGHDLFLEVDPDDQPEYSATAWQKTLDFISNFLERPPRTAERKTY
jgi:carboxymethylenebutenolidase